MVLQLQVIGSAVVMGLQTIDAVDISGSMVVAVVGSSVINIVVSGSMEAAVVVSSVMDVVVSGSMEAVVVSSSHDLGMCVVFQTSKKTINEETILPWIPVSLDLHVTTM